MADTRTHLLDAALLRFAAQGYDAVGVQEIAVAVGVGKPSLYHHFGNKAGLLAAVLARHGEPIASAIADASTYQGDLPLALHRVVRAYFGDVVQQPTFHRLRLALYFAPPDNPAGQLAAAHLAHERALLEAMFEAASRDHGNMRGRARPYAAALLGAIHAPIGLFLRDAAPLDDDVAFRTTHQFMHGIYS